MRHPKFNALGNSASAILLLFYLASVFVTTAAAKSREHVIYAFSECAFSTARLIADADGNLYGTTLDGGASQKGCIFEVSRDKNGVWTGTVLHSFNGTDGFYPTAALVFDKLGNLYGTTVQGGVYGAGVAFELSPSSNGEWVETVLHNFGGAGDGSAPESELIFDKDGNLYGTTSFGGQHRGGTVFELSPSDGGWTETILYSFFANIGGGGGDSPAGGVVMDGKGNLYGVTGWGGHGAGTVYELSLKDGIYKEHIIHSFSGYDGAEPNSTLVMDVSGNLYGTTTYGGNADFGTVFKLTKVGGKWTENVLLLLNGNDGYSPVGPVAIDRDGNVYVAGQFGGLNANGSVLKLTPKLDGSWRETILHLFDFRAPNGVDGARPYAGVTLDRGQLFGTTSSGGIHYAGTVFRIKLYDPDTKNPAIE
jgi:uncharacterized repeat protein (TIGR03803 family)